MLIRVEPGKHGGNHVVYTCDNCGRETSLKKSHYEKSKMHFCCLECKTIFSGHHNVITQEEVKKIISYDPDTGIFTNIHTGKECGFVRTNGYIGISLHDKGYYAHRVAWLYTYGKWPKETIDHINGNITDNRLCNLRAVSNRVNNQNHKVHREGKLPGATFYNNRWHSRFVYMGGKIYLGCFDTEREAHDAYMAKLKELGEI